MKFSELIELKKIARRNLARHRVKTVITVIAVMVSVALYIFMDGWLLGMNQESRRNIVNYETGAAKFQSRAYFDKKDDLPMYESFEQWEDYAAVLERAGYDSAPRFVFGGTLDSNTGSAPVVFNAVDPASEKKLLRYANWLESGRFIRPGAFEIVLGSVAAEKLKTGVPQRPLNTEFAELLAEIGGEEDRRFVESLYERAVPGKKRLYEARETIAQGEYRLVLKNDISAADQERLWDILAGTGRMDLRVSTAIDMKAAPLSIRGEKFDAEIAPFLSAAEGEAIRSAYAYDTILEAWTLVSDDPLLLEQSLAALVRIDYTGAIRHVYQVFSVTLAGVINSPDPKTNFNIAWIPLDALQDEAGMMLEGRVTELLIREKNMVDTNLPGKHESPQVITAALEQELAAQGRALPVGLAVYSWIDYAADYIAVANGDDVSSRIMIVFLFILSFLGIANTMLMAILERTKEIGMMRALGMSDGQLIFVYMLEAGFVGAIGSICGVIAGCLINIPMVKYGINFSATMDAMGGDMGYRIASDFRSAWNVPVIVGSAVAAMALSSLTALLPCRRALKTPVTEALRFE